MLQHAAQMGALQHILVALTIRFEEIPRVRLQDRVVVLQESEDFYRITVRYGFIEVPDLQNDLQQARTFGCPIDLSRAIFFAVRYIVVPNQKKPALERWRVLLFRFLNRNAVRAVDLFHLPIDRFVEVDRQVAISSVLRLDVPSQCVGFALFRDALAQCWRVVSAARRATLDSCLGFSSAIVAADADSDCVRAILFPESV